VDLVRDNSRHFDRLFTHSRWYAEHLAASIGLERDRFEQIPLSIDCELPETAVEKFNDSAPKTIGYFARICPEKGIDNFLNAAQQIATTDDSLQFRIAGYLPELHRRWFHGRLEEVQHIVGPDRLQWLGSPETREDKFRLLSSYDLLCVPTNYREPKAIFMLEAALVGVPSLVPDHGAFPERIHELGRGWTYPAISATALGQAILHAVQQLDSDTSKHLRRTVRQKFAVSVTGPVISQVLERIATS
jgi:glycosyltransferase involved in cell wall biosynthesis